MHNILIISCVFPPEPVVSANLSYDLAIELSKKYNVTVISPKPSRPMAYDFTNATYKKQSFQHLIMNSFTHPKSTFIGRFSESYSFGKACENYIKNNKTKIDLIYLNTWPILGQFFVIRVASRYNIPTVLHIQDIYPEAFLNKLPSWIGSFVYQLLIPIERFVTKQSTRIVTISKGMSKLLTETRNLPSSKIEVIYNWQDETKYLVDAQLESSSSTAKFIHFMFLGSLGPVANIDNLIRAFAQLSKDEIFFTITGEGSEKVKLQKLAQKLNASNILFKLAPSSEVGQIQASAHILLLSLKKGAAGLALPSKLPAYMLSAKPIIATVDLNSDTAEAIREAGCGWVIEPEQPEILAKLIKEIQEMPKSELIIMGAKGREYAMKHFSKKNNLSKLVDNIENLLKR